MLERSYDRERAPMYVAGETTGDMRFVFEQKDGIKPIDLAMEDMFGKAPRTFMKDHTVEENYQDVAYETGKIHEYLENVLQLEAVACKDWLTNKVDRSVTGKVARQQMSGRSTTTSQRLWRSSFGLSGEIGYCYFYRRHAPQAATIDPAAGSGTCHIWKLSTNIVWSTDDREIEKCIVKRQLDVAM